MRSTLLGRATHYRESWLRFIVCIPCDSIPQNRRNHYNVDFGMYLQLIFTTLLNFKNFKNVVLGFNITYILYSKQCWSQKALWEWTCPPPFNFIAPAYRYTIHPHAVYQLLNVNLCASLKDIYQPFMPMERVN